MNNKEKDVIVISLIDGITSNNLPGVTSELKNLNYESPFAQMNVYEAKTALYQLYLLNSDEFWNAISKVPFQYNKTDISTSPSTRDKFREMVKSLKTDRNINEENKEWWTEVINACKVINNTTEQNTASPKNIDEKTLVKREANTAPTINLYWAITFILIAIILTALITKSIK